MLFGYLGSSLMGFSASISTVSLFCASPDFRRNTHHIQEKYNKVHVQPAALQIQSKKRSPDVLKAAQLYVLCMCVFVGECVCMWWGRIEMRLYQHRRCFNESLQRHWKRC